MPYSMPGATPPRPADATIYRRPVRCAVRLTVLGIAPDTELEVALQLMTRSNSRHVPVVANRRCVGLLNESDILWTMSAHLPTRFTAGDCCRRPAPMVDIDDTVGRAAEVIDGGGLGGAVVVEHGQVAGIITEADIVRLVASESLNRGGR